MPDSSDMDAEAQTTAYDEEFSCSIHVDATMERDRLCEAIAQVLGGSVRLFTIELAGVDISVYPNLTFDLSQRTGNRDDFWSYRYYLTVDVRQGRSRAATIALVSQLLRYLWAQGWRAVAISLYESDLPQESEYQM